MWNYISQHATESKVAERTLGAPRPQLPACCGAPILAITTAHALRLCLQYLPLASRWQQRATRHAATLRLQHRSLFDAAPARSVHGRKQNGRHGFPGRLLIKGTPDGNGQKRHPALLARRKQLPILNGPVPSGNLKLPFPACSGNQCGRPEGQSPKTTAPGMLRGKMLLATIPEPDLCFLTSRLHPAAFPTPALGKR